MFFALLIGAVYLVYQLFSPYLGALAMATIFAVVFSPLHNHLLKLMPKHTALAALVTLFVVIVVVLVPVVFYGIILSDEIKNFYDESFSLIQGDGFIARITLVANNYIQSFSPFGITWPVFDIVETQTYVFQVLSWFRSHFGDIFSGLAKLFVDIFIFLIALYYFIKDGKNIREHIIAISPLNDKNDEAILTKLRAAIVSIIKGSILVAVIQGFTSGFGYYVFGVPSPFLWAGVAAIAALIPGIGTGLVNLPIVIYLFFTGDITHAVGMALWAVFAVGFIDNFIGPKFQGKGLKIHPFLILISVLGGLTFFGPLGFIFGPITLSFLYALIEIYKTSFMKEEAETHHKI